MNENELIGELYTALKKEQAEYAKLIALIERIKSREVDPALILIVGNSWQLIPGVKVEPPAASVVLGPGASITRDGVTYTGETPAAAVEQLDATPQQ